MLETAAQLQKRQQAEAAVRAARAADYARKMGTQAPAPAKIHTIDTVEEARAAVTVSVATPKPVTTITTKEKSLRKGRNDQPTDKHKAYRERHKAKLAEQQRLRRSESVTIPAPTCATGTCPECDKLAKALASVLAYCDQQGLDATVLAAAHRALSELPP